MYRVLVQVSGRNIPDVLLGMYRAVMKMLRLFWAHGLGSKEL